MAASEPEFIVAEISKNWPDEEVHPTGNWIAVRESKPILCQQFEEVINRNNRIGYALHSFQLNHCLSPDGRRMSETIIAVFRKKGPDDR